MQQKRVEGVSGNCFHTSLQKSRQNIAQQDVCEGQYSNMPVF